MIKLKNSVYFPIQNVLYFITREINFKQKHLRNVKQVIVYYLIICQ
jgi:hypothetical protein